MAMCECRACGKRFRSTSGFDTHRTGRTTQTGPDYGRRCLTDDELLGRDLVNVMGVWKGRPADTPHWGLRFERPAWIGADD
jgi:hypothetical protein